MVSNSDLSQQTSFAQNETVFSQETFVGATSTITNDIYHNDLTHDMHTLVEKEMEITKNFISRLVDQTAFHKVFQEIEERFEIFGFYRRNHQLLDTFLVIFLLALAMKILRSIIFAIVGGETTLEKDDSAINSEFSNIRSIEREYVKNFEIVPLCKPNYGKEEDLLEKLYSDFAYVKNDNLIISESTQNDPFCVVNNLSGTDSNLFGNSSLMEETTSADYHKDGNGKVSQETHGFDLSEKCQSSLSAPSPNDKFSDSESLKSDHSVLSQSSRKQMPKRRASKQLVFKNSFSVLENTSEVKEKNGRPTSDVTQETVYSYDFSKTNDKPSTYFS